MEVDYDPYSAEAMHDPRRLYALLREHDPVHYMPQYDAWALAAFEDVWQACSDTASFSVRRGQTPNQVLLGEPAANLTFPELDPPEHRLRRRAIAPSYTRDAAVADGEAIRDITREVLAPLVARGSFDAFADFASVVSARVAAWKAGVPDSERVRPLLHTVMIRDDGQRGSSPVNQAAMGEVFGYLGELVTAARAGEAERRGVLGILLDSTVHDDPLSDAQITAELHTLLVTGSETVEIGIAAALYYLARDPDQRAALLDDASLAPWAFAEAIRFDHPTDMLCRTVVRDVEVGAKLLRAGQGVLLLWGSANRDEHEFERADEFDIHRRPARTLAFGHGQHKCIGEHIAMQMGTIMLEEFVAAVQDYAVDEAHVRRRSAEFLKGLSALPVRVEARASAAPRGR